jgi:hypothetical protein
MTNLQCLPKPCDRSQELSKLHAYSEMTSLRKCLMFKRPGNRARTQSEKRLDFNVKVHKVSFVSLTL